MAYMNPFVSGMQAGEQLVNVPFQQHMQRKKLVQQKEAQQAALAFQQQKIAQQQPYLDARTAYMQALAQGQGQGTAMTPSVTMQTGVAPTVTGGVSQTGGVAPPTGVPPQSSAQAAQMPPPSAVASGAAAPPSSVEGTPSSAQQVDQVPSSQGGTGGYLGTQTGASPIMANPYSMSKYSRRGAVLSVQDPQTHQVYSGASPTIRAQTYQELKGAGIAELGNVVPVIHQAFEDYGGNPAQSYWKLAKDMALSAQGNEAATKRLTNLATANRLRPDVGMVIGRALMGGVPRVETMAQIVHSQYGGIPSTLSWMPTSIQEASAKRYNEYVKSMGRSGQQEVLGGSYVPMTKQTVIQDGIPRPAFKSEGGEDTIGQNVTSPALSFGQSPVNGGTVKMKAPNGKIYVIPRDKVEQYTNIGGVVINGN